MIFFGEESNEIKISYIRGCLRLVFEGSLACFALFAFIATAANSGAAVNQAILVRMAIKIRDVTIATVNGLLECMAKIKSLLKSEDH